MNVRCTVVAVCLITEAFAQGNKTADVTGQYPDLIEIDPFGGLSTWAQISRGLDTKLHDDWLVGGRVAFNPTKYFGFELWMDYDRANVSFRLPSNGGIYPATSPFAGAPIPTYSFHAANWMWGFDPMVNLKPRGSPFQPYVSAGIGGVRFTPSSDAMEDARNPIISSSFHSATLDEDSRFQLNYGGGVKWHTSDHWGFRLDARGFWSHNPTYNLPTDPTNGIYIPNGYSLNGFQASLGIVFYAGHK